MRTDPSTRRLIGHPALAAVLGLLAAGCTSQVRNARSATSVAPMLSVERFLQASNEQDYEAMARLFGTQDGPVVDTGSTFGCAFKKMGSWIGLSSSCIHWRDVELRMDAISQILRHDDYRVVGERQEPGRQAPTNRISVDLTMADRVVHDVPFLVVRAHDGSWLVSEIDLQRVAGS